MDPLYLRKRLINQNFNNRALDIHKTEKTDSVNISQDAKTNIKNQAENLAQDIRSEVLNPKQLKMNFLAGMERAGYVKKVMNLPKTLPELLMQLQNEDSIVQEEYTPKYNQEGEGEKNNKEQPKSDIREGVIRNAKETFEGVKGQIEAEKPSSLAAKKELPQVEQPNIPKNNEVQKPSSLVAKEELPHVEQPNVPKNNEVQKPSNLAANEELPNINQPNIPNKTPENTEVKHDSPQPTTPTTPTAPQTPNQPVQNKPAEQPQVKPSLPNIPQEQPTINKPIINQPQQETPVTQNPQPNVPQQPRPSMPDVPNIEQPQQPVVNQPNVPNKTPQNTEIKPDLPQQTTPQTPNQPVQNKPVEQPQVKPSLPNTPEVEPQPINKPVINQPTNEQPRPNVPQEQQPIINKPVVNQPQQETPVTQNPQPNVPQQPRPSMPDVPHVEQPHQPVVNQPTEQPSVKPNLPNTPDVEPQPINKPVINQPTNEQPKPNVPQQPRPSMPDVPNIEQPQQPVVNQPTEQPSEQPRPNVPQQPRPSMPDVPNIEQPTKPIVNQPTEQPSVKPNLPNTPDVEPQPINKPVINQPTNEQPKPNVPQQPRPSMPDVPNIEQPTKPVVNQPTEQPSEQPRPNVPQQPRPSMPDVPHVEQPQQPVVNQPNIPNTKPQPNAPEGPNQTVRPNVPEPHINRPEPRPELPNYRPFEPIHHPEMNNMRPHTIIDNRAAILQNQINQNMPFIKPEDPNRHHHHHLENRPHTMDDTPKPENIQPQIVQNTQTEPTMTEMKQKLSGDATELFFTGLINLNDLSSSLKDGSKTARSKLIMAMANASRQGIDNSQINDTMKLLNAGMIAEENSTPSKILKNIIELYLPWYPLQQGVGFDLSIETTQGGSESFLSTLKVWIQTRNYGNVNAILALMAGNSVDMSIKCAKLFPKDELLKRLKEETSTHSMQSNINVEEISRVESYMNSDQQAKVNLSSTYELNPYLLLMAHSFIKNTIIIDSSAIIG